MNQRLPNLIIIGAEKCGTTSLHRYLALHPDIFMSKTKELNFFIEDENWKNGLEWYKSQFASRKEKILGESSPRYTRFLYTEKVSDKMYAIIPRAKLIYLVRNPIERIVSHYIQLVAVGQDYKLLNKGLESYKNNLYVQTSRYTSQLNYFLRLYPLSQILIVCSEELDQFREETIQNVFRFLEVDEGFLSEEFNERHNISSNKKKLSLLGRVVNKIPYDKKLTKEWVCCRSPIAQPYIDPILLKEIHAYLKEDVEELRKYSNIDFKKWWNI